MADIEVTKIVKRPVVEVFKLVSDIPSYSKGVSPISSMFTDKKVTPAGPVGVGTTFEDKLQYGKTVGKVVEYQPFNTLINHSPESNPGLRPDPAGPA